MLKEVLVRLSVIAFVCCLSVTAHAMADQKAHVNVPAGDLTAGLELLAKQSGAEFVYRADQLKGLRTGGVTGDLSPKEAVTKLLIGTPLQLRMDPSGAMLIAPARANTTSDASSPAGSDQSQEGKSDSSGGFLVAQVDQKPAGPQVEEKKEEEKKAAALQEVVVTGTHIRGLKDGPSPVQTLDRTQIDATGFSNVPQLMQSLPSNSSGDINVGTYRAGVTTGHAGSNVGYTSTVNLRGLGSDATLVLLDGQRMPLSSSGYAPDISSIPLAVVDHVDVLKDGASSIYGSDAVAGVVNFVTIKNFDGIRTTATAGSVTQGQKIDYQVSQLVGHNWDSGNALFDYVYDRQDSLSALSRSCCSSASPPADLMPSSLMNSVFAGVRQEFGSAFEVNGKVLFTHRNLSSINAESLAGPGIADTLVKTDTLLSAVGLIYKLPSTWRLSLNGSYTDDSTDSSETETALPDQIYHFRGRDYSVDSQADGSIFDLPGGPAKLAIGASFRHESYRELAVPPLIPTGYDLGREIVSGYGEVFVPIVGESNEVPGVKRLELTGAVRSEHYSDFGRTTNPKAGLVWSPLTDVAVRATYSTSFRAPLLAELERADAHDYLLLLPDPLSGSGNSVTIFRTGGNSSLQPETSKNYTAGITWSPARTNGPRIDVDYFNIRFDHRIDNPGGGVSLIELRPDLYGNFLTRNPSVSLVNSIVSGPAFQNFFGPFSPSDIALIADDRLTNISSEVVSGVELGLRYSPPTSRGNLDMGLDATYLHQYEVTLLPGSPPLDRLGTPYYPSNFRLRSTGSWTLDHVTLTLTGNYVNSYEDNRIAGATVPVASWTTIDMQVAYSFSAALLGDSAQSQLALSVQNLLNKSPPFVLNENPPTSTSYGYNFDPANSSPLGRYVALRFSYGW